jgi:hypothetical protein
MIRLKNRLKNLEYSIAVKQQEQRHKLEKLQEKLGLPLPTTADFAEGLRRLQDVIERLRDAATVDEGGVILNEFRDWALSQRVKHG